MANKTVVVIGTDGKEEPLSSSDTAVDTSGTAIGSGGAANTAYNRIMEARVFRV